MQKRNRTSAAHPQMLPQIAREMPGDQILFVPDIFFAENLEEELRGTKTVIYPGKGNQEKGAVCEVHEKFLLSDLVAIRESFDIPKGHPTRILYAHWECRPRSASGSRFLRQHEPDRQGLSPSGWRKIDWNALLLRRSVS